MRTKATLSLGFMLVALAPNAHAQSTLLDDINPTGSSSPTSFVKHPVNGLILFVADDGSSGREVWKYEVGAGVSQVIDLDAAATDSVIGDLVVVNSTVCFAATAGLYCTEGTASQTTEVFTGTAAALVGAGSVGYFSCDDGNGPEPCTTDGTRPGTSQLLDINAAGGSFPSTFVQAGTRVFFFADDGGGSALWVSDGTQGGTVEVPSGAGFSIFSGAAVGDIFFFVGGDATNGNELWSSDGTDVGTSIVKDINPGTASSSPADLLATNGQLFFVAEEAGSGREVWVSDGTDAGTQMVRDVNPGTGTGAFGISATVTANGFYATRGTDGTNGTELLCTDGTDAGTTLFDIDEGAGSGNAFSLVALGDTVAFAATDGTTGSELFTADCGAGTSQLVEDLAPADSFPNNLAAIDGTLFFAADDGTTGTEPYSVIPPGVAAPGPDIRVVRADGTEVAYGSVQDLGRIASANQCRTYTIENVGQDDLTLGDLDIQDSGADTLSEVRVAERPTSPVAPGGSTTLEICFTPVSTSSLTGRVDIFLQMSLVTNDPDENPFTFGLEAFIDEESGGCSSLSSGRGALWLLGLALVLRRRRLARA